MTKLLLTLAFLGLLASCQHSGPYYHQMTPAELARHNQDKAPANQIVCIERDTVASRIRKKRCATRAFFMNENQRNAALVSTAGAGPAPFIVQ